MKLIDGLERVKESPKTFEVPSDFLKASVAAGDYVKVGIEVSDPAAPFAAERFWVIVKAITDDGFEGVVNNDLTMTDFHGVKCDDPIRFEARHILAIFGEQ